MDYLYLSHEALRYRSQDTVRGARVRAHCAVMRQCTAEMGILAAQTRMPASAWPAFIHVTCVCEGVGSGSWLS